MGEHIYTLRVNLRLSQSELAQKCGVSQQYISLIERNEKTPSLRTAKKLADILGVTLDELIAEK